MQESAEDLIDGLKVSQREMRCKRCETLSWMTDARRRKKGQQLGAVVEASLRSLVGSSPSPQMYEKSTTPSSAAVLIINHCTRQGRLRPRYRHRRLEYWLTFCVLPAAVATRPRNPSGHTSISLPDFLGITVTTIL